MGAAILAVGVAIGGLFVGSGFARDSRSEIGGIRSASQGVFEILPRDQAQGISEASQIVKTVRVVSTIDYSLKN